MCYHTDWSGVYEDTHGSSSTQHRPIINLNKFSDDDITIICTKMKSSDMSSYFLAINELYGGQILQIENDATNIFKKMIERSHYKVAKMFYEECSFCQFEIHLFKLAFSFIDNVEHLKIINELKSLDQYISLLLFIKACEWNHLSTVQWLLKEKSVNIRYAEDAAFKIACLSGHLMIMNWLCSLCDDYNYIKIDNDSMTDDSVNYQYIINNPVSERPNKRQKFDFNCS
jgi:hypothetical protein